MSEPDKKEADSRADAWATLAIILIAVAAVSFFVYQPV